jgi:glycosyltransferase involved in cell wall biosynthesis
VGLVVTSHGPGRGSPWLTASSTNSTRVELLTNAMLLVLSSDLGGLSLALPDAMRAGLCVLAGDVPENRELVKDVGFTFARGSVADLAPDIEKVYFDPVGWEAVAESTKKPSGRVMNAAAAHQRRTG